MGNAWFFVSCKGGEESLIVFFHGQNTAQNSWMFAGMPGKQIV